MGGPEMAKAGMECIFGMDELSVMGFTDVIPKIFRSSRSIRGIKQLMDERRPGLFIPVDLPDFNMRLARYAKAKNLNVLYYIAPQAWAWRRGRAETLARVTDGLAVIFPFEENFFTSSGVNTRYVGHPFVEAEAAGSSWKASWPPKHIGIMPGSRYQLISEDPAHYDGCETHYLKETPGYHLAPARGKRARYTNHSRHGRYGHLP